MSRIRYIKPEFFTNEDVGCLPPLHRILFIGLWTEADRVGRLADKPKTLKVKLLPYDDVDVDAMLADLAKAGFIHRYEVAGTAVIQVVNFHKHQRPHPKEVDLGFPDPPTPKPAKTEPSREISRKEISGQPSIPSSPVGREGNGEGRRKVEGTEPAGSAALPPLVDRLNTIFRRTKGTDYVPDERDLNASRELMAKARGNEAEIERRWGIALTKRFPACSTLFWLNKNWNDYASADPPPLAATGTKGRAAEADKDWSQPQETIETANGREIKW